MLIVRLAVVASLFALGACAGPSRLPVDAGFGADPQLPPPRQTLIPTVKIAPAVGWPAGAAPVAAEGLGVQAFADGLDHPRWLYRLPNGDVLVAETNKPTPPPTVRRGLREWVMDKVMARAGAGVPSPDRITLLRDADGDGVAELKTPFLTGLHSPFGMALAGDRLFIANADAVVAVPYRSGQTRIDVTPVRVADLPAGRNHHWTKSLVASPDGSRLYVGVGSNSNVGEYGLDEEVDRAAILEIDPATGARRVYASGLRNPVGMDWSPDDGRLWVAVNERDEIGHDLVPDYMTAVQPGGFYGWPWSYWGRNVDRRPPPDPAMVARAVRPDYALGAHTASLGLAFSQGSLLPPDLRDGVFVGQHGSWNRSPRTGYKVIFAPFSAGRPAGPPRDVLTGFLDPEGRAMGRPVGVAFDQGGALLVADDVGNTIWRVAPSR